MSTARPASQPRGSNSTTKEKKIRIYNSWFDATNPKAAKGREFGVLNGIHYMAAAKSAGGETVCEWAFRCVMPCLVTSGKGLAPNVIKGRRERTLLYWRDPEAYANIHRRAALGGGKIKISLVQVADRMGLRPALRLNGTSDLRWESTGLIHDLQRQVTCYEYTKSYERVLNSLARSGDFRGLNYHMTMSLGGTLDVKASHASRVYREILDAGGTVAAVWATHDMAKKYVESGIDAFLLSNQKGEITQRIDLGHKRRVIDGNELNGDLRFLDPKGVVVALYAKGRTEKLDTAPKRFFMHNPSRSDRLAAVVTEGLPMGSMRQEGPHIYIDAEPE